MNWIDSLSLVTLDIYCSYILMIFKKFALKAFLMSSNVLSPIWSFDLDNIMRDSCYTASINAFELIYCDFSMVYSNLDISSVYSSFSLVNFSICNLALFNWALRSLNFLFNSLFSISSVMLHCASLSNSNYIDIICEFLSSNWWDILSYSSYRLVRSCESTFT